MTAQVIFWKDPCSPWWSEMSDEALRHAVYLSKISGTEIDILHVLERKSREKGRKSPTTKEEDDIRQLLEKRIKLCKKAGINEVSYIIRAGRPADPAYLSIFGISIFERLSSILKWKWYFSASCCIILRARFWTSIHVKSLFVIVWTDYSFSDVRCFEALKPSIQYMPLLTL